MRRCRPRQLALASETVELLEPRKLLSAAAASARASAGTPDRPLVHELIDLARLPKQTAATLRSAGATLWGALNGVGSPRNAKAEIKPNAYAPFALDLATLRNTLAAAPLEFSKAAKRSPLTFAGSAALIPVYRSPDLGTTGALPVAQVLNVLRAK